MKEQQKSFTEQAQKTGGIVVELIHASVILLRLISRVPGSIGGKFLFPGILWSLLCFAFLSQHPDRSADLERPFITVVGWLWLLHMFAFALSWKGKQGTYAHHTGKGWLNILFPQSNRPKLLAVQSDGIVAAALALFCQSQGDIGLARYWVISAVLSVISTGLIGTRDFMRGINVGSATAQQRHWQNFIPVDEDLE